MSIFAILNELAFLVAKLLTNSETQENETRIHGKYESSKQGRTQEIETRCPEEA
jgi:hypothetical protein